ncbi:hypothetical protein [Massilia sp. BKSP1R2A-1]|uniref:hypothetical protein n=1 Tax=Massilia sp. BKSP1R2A-1 TaxID=3422595 RepID=UPI003D325AAC
MKKVGFVKKWFMAVVCLTMLVQQQQHALAQAQAVAPVANYVVNRAVAGTIAKVALQRGFAANDPRIVVTMAGVGSSMTTVNVASTVGGVALAVAGAPVWLTVLGGLGILALGAAIVAGSTSLKVDNGTVTVVTGAPTSPPPYNPPSTDLLPSTDPDYRRIAQYLADGSKLYRYPIDDSQNWTCRTGKPCASLPEFLYANAGAPVWRTSLCLSGGSPISCVNGGRGMVIPYFTMEEFGAHYFDGALWNGPNGGGSYTRITKRFVDVPVLTWDAAGNGSIQGTIEETYECREGSPTGPYCFAPSVSRSMFFSSNEAQNLQFYKPQSTEQKFSSLDAAVSGMDASQKATKLSPEVLAQLVDKAWQNAASQPNYQGLPYSATQPVTPAEVTSWQNENPSLNPTLGDLLVPAVAPGTVAVPISPDVTLSPSPNPDPGTGEPTPAPVGTTNVNVVNVPTVRVEWGADPGIGASSLEQTPTASAILSPLLNLMPSLRNFAVPAHNSVCPKPSFSMFEKQIVMEAHCAVLDDVKPTLYAVMGFVWLMLGAIIILRA